MSVSSGVSLQSEVAPIVQGPGFPKLIWEKKLSRSITSSAISNDGAIVAVADESGFLTLYSAKGKKLWAYHYVGQLPKRILEYAPDKSQTDTIILNIKFSQSGKHLIATLGVLNTYNSCEGSEGGCGIYESRKTLCFNADGKLLWSTSKSGESAIGGDSYVLIAQQYEGEGGVFEETAYSLLNIAGQIKQTGTVDAKYSGISANGDYIFSNKKLINTKTGKVMWELEDKYSFWGRGSEKYAAAYHDEWGKRGVHIFSVVEKKKVLDLPGVYLDDVSLRDSYVAVSVRQSGRRNLSVRDMKTGEIIWKYLCDPKKHTDGGTSVFYLAKDGKHLFLGTDYGMQLYDIRFGELWSFPLKLNTNLALKSGGVDKFKYYSVTEDAKFVLIGNAQKMILFSAY